MASASRRIRSTGPGSWGSRMMSELIPPSSEASAIRRRPETGLLAGLWEFPNLDGARTEAEVRDYLQTIGLSPGKLLPLAPARHIFTHIQWEMTGYLAEAASPLPLEGCVWVLPEELGV